LEGYPINYLQYQFITKQPPPGILLACKEARAIGLQYYFLSFDIDYDPGIGFKATTPARIWRNFEADRICPMGTYQEEAHSEMWCAIPPPSCAINLYVKPSNRHLPGPIDSLLFCAEGFHEEVLLYHCEEELWNIRSLEFADLTEDKAKPKEWQAFTEAKEKLLKELKAWEDNEKIRIKKWHQDKGEKVPEDPKTGWEDGFPEFKLVAIVVNGVRR
jgi:hypothetical protein